MQLCHRRAACFVPYMILRSRRTWPSGFGSGQQSGGRSYINLLTFSHSSVPAAYLPSIICMSVGAIAFFLKFFLEKDLRNCVSSNFTFSANFLSDFLEMGWEIILLREDRDCAPLPPNMFSGLFFVATLARGVHCEFYNWNTIESAGANPL